MPESFPADEIETLVSPSRFASYVAAADGDRAAAVELYRWNVALTAACFEAFHYVEVVVRNAMDRALHTYYDEHRRGIPWFLLPIDGKNEASFHDSIARVRRRLRDESRSKETRDQILSGVDFGFWTALLQTNQEELWRHALRHAFPYSSGNRKDVAPVLLALRPFRNRLAHHDSLLAVDVLFQLRQMARVLSWINPTAERWLLDIERVSEVYATRPLTPQDTVVVAAADAWPLYRAVGAYLCQVGRTFRPVERLAFYAERVIKKTVPAIVHRVDNVEWSEVEAARLASSSDTRDRRLADIIRGSRDLGWTDGRYQVLDLSRVGDERHRELGADIPHLDRGRGSAFTQRQRYTSLTALERASTTADLS